ncbi:hypothetical protein PIB30_035720 [Stylosanthes scabra]|uniref:Transcription factor CBF/NF-Y/archaeal histone domain-containing protein n=1 Tax=Stylosanthes scabra TaxID=79078 RepID=A0ABU6YBK1_9FABA|nr:hypothetical protein [Stylosanthes scabra]
MMSDAPANPGGSGKEEEESSDSLEEDRCVYLPYISIKNAMKRVLPREVKISEDAELTVQKCVSEFISYVTTKVCEKKKKEGRKATISGNDVIKAMIDLGFGDDRTKPLQVYLNKLTETETPKRDPPTSLENERNKVPKLGQQ